MFYVNTDDKDNLVFSNEPKPDFAQVLEAVDMVKHFETFRAVERIWEAATREHVKEHGDGGTCVIGAGIEVLYIPQKTKKLKGLKSFKIASQPSCCQGSINWEGERLQKALDYLTREGITSARYSPGWMD